MQRYPTLMLAALLLVSALLASCGSRAATVTPPISARFAVDPTYPPFESVDFNTKATLGFDVDLIRAIGRKAGVAVELYTVSLPQVLTGMAQCEYDGAISAITISDELKAQMNFSKPYFTFGQVVAVKGGNTAVTGRDRLAGRTVGVQRNSTSEREARKIAGAQVRLYQNFDLAFQDLRSGMIDAVVADKVTALGYAGERAGNLKIVGGEWAPEDLGIAVCKNNPELLKRLDAGLAAVKADGTLDKLKKQWLDNPQLD